MKVTPIEGTPFACVQMKEEEQEFALVIGNNIVSPKVFTSEEQCRTHVEEMSWGLLATTIMVLCEKVIDQKRLHDEREEE